jgi:transcriptional regulator of acetoin/glycerol metabolism
MYTDKEKDEIIKRSHKRSEVYGIEKERVISKKILSGKDVSENIRKNKELIRIAAPFTKSLYDFLRGSGFIVVLTDREGCILNIIGDKEIVEAAKGLDMKIGAYMDEKSIGTNAMGTAISEDAPIQISASEHFINAYHRWTCSAAPIHGIKGEIIGTLNLTGNSRLIHQHTLGLVAASVKSIENQLKSEAVQNKLKEAYQYNNAIMNATVYGIMSLDRDGIIRSINNTGCGMLKIQRKDIINCSISGILSSWESLFSAIDNGKIYRDEEVNFKIHGTKERYSISAEPIRDENGKVNSLVITFKELQKVLKLVNKYTGMNARYTFMDLVGESSELRGIVEYAKKVADSPSTILIEGESGTGKEVLAQAIHNYSDRREHGFVAINCGAISKSLIESELFGYEEGAFTGAKKGGHPGKFEQANGGTLFLDEIGEMPLDMQVNLLRVLQEGCVTRVGGNKYIPVNVRIIAATNKDLRREVAKGNFRQDLYYRISVIPLILPPLRERKDDISALVEHFLNIKALKLNRQVPALKEDIREFIFKYSWPGNIRELENFIEKYVNLEGQISRNIMNEYLGEKSETELATRTLIACTEDRELPGTLEAVEEAAILKTLELCDNNITKTAKSLGISRNTLYLKLKKFNIIMNQV